MHVDVNFITQTIAPVVKYQQEMLHNVEFKVDSRLVQPGDFFVALSGQKSDGHDFIDQALSNGAAGFILAFEKKDAVLARYAEQLSNKTVLFVSDPLQALIDLARAWRQKFTIPIVGITGTVGKTTTKEMVRNILKVAHRNALVSAGNQNTLIGLSLNILKLRDFHQAAVFELGIAQQGSMKKLVDLVRPTYCVITQVGHGHLEGLGSIASVAKEKRSIFSLFGQHDIGVINGDQKELSDISYHHPVIRFGKKTVNQIQARKIVCVANTVSFIAKIYNQRYNVVLSTCNQSRVMNALAAIAVGKLLEIPDETIIAGVQEPISVEGRFQIVSSAIHAEIINDAYNANPESMKASLQAFDQFQTDKQKIVVLGDMLELGDESSFWHRHIGRLLCKMDDVATIVLIGSEVAWIKKMLPSRIKSHLFENTQQALSLLQPMVKDTKNVILFKSSRSMNFIELIEKLQS